MIPLRAIVISLGLWSGVAAAEPSGFVAATDARLRWMGRTAPADDGGGLTLAYPGVAVRFTYRGAAPVLRLRAHSEQCYFNLSINGWESAVLHLAAGENEIPLLSGPAPAEGWVVQLVRRTEAWQGLVTFEGIVVPDGGEVLAGPTWPERKIMVIGDSITTGHYIEQLPGVPDPTPRSNNAERTWGWKLARELGAQVHIVAYGGRGLTRTWDGRTDQANAPQFFERTLPDDEAAAWDHERYAPDVIVIMLGQNDFSRGILPHDEFVGAYAALLERIFAAHPAAAVVLTGSPMHGVAPGSEDATKRATLYSYLRDVAATRRAAGQTRMTVAEVSHQPGTTLNAHPTVFQNEQIAAELEPVVRELTGW